MSSDQDVPFFTMVRSETIRWPVKVPVPRDGQYVYATFTAELLNMSEEDREAWLFPKDMTKRPTDREVATRVLLGVHGLVGEDKKVMESSPELVTQMLAVDRAPAAIAATWLSVLRGVAALKN